MTGVTKRVGLAVMDIQTLHRGHNNLLNEMRMCCDKAVIGLGSVRRFGTPGHPFTFEQRAEMVRAIHGGFFDFVALDDIDASHDIRAWYDYVGTKIAKAGLPEPTDYFGGSQIDGKWYFHAFASPDCPAQPQAGAKAVYVNPETGKRLHLVDRTALGLPSGREVRLLIETRDEEWKRYVPERLHAFVEWEYPPHLRQPLPDPDVLWKPASGHAATEFGTYEKLVDGIRTAKAELTVKGNHPVGTRVSTACLWPGRLGPGEPLLLELKDDGRWRPLDTRDEKAEWAMENRRAAP